MVDDRAGLRALIRGRLLALSQDTRAASDRAIQRRLADDLPPDGDVLAYAALADEVDLGPLLEDLAAQGRLLLPRVVGETLDLVRITDLQAQLQPGRWGIREPVAALEAERDVAPVVLWVPGRAFDRRGGRLGRGGGFYDRLLAGRLSTARKVGVSRDVQMVERVPMAAHDVWMDGVCTESAWWTSVEDRYR